MRLSRSSRSLNTASILISPWVGFFFTSHLRRSSHLAFSQLLDASPFAHLPFLSLSFSSIQTQAIMKRLSPDEAILGALRLYLDAINLFLQVLRVVSLSTSFSSTRPPREVSSLTPRASTLPLLSLLITSARKLQPRLRDQKLSSTSNQAHVPVSILSPLRLSLASLFLLFVLSI